MKNDMWAGRSRDDDDLHRYDDILRLPHHVSTVHPPMPVLDRAAQFAPFAALTGHGEAIRETARLTEEKVELDENCLTELDGKLQMIKERLPSGPVIMVTYFKPDGKKQGGAYVTIKGRVKKINEYAHTLAMEDGEEIPLDDIAGIDW